MLAKEIELEKVKAEHASRGLSILLHGVISLPGATPCDKCISRYETFSHTLSGQEKRFSLLQ